MSEREKFPQKKAVALKYDPERDGAPKVVASGRGETAERIIETAKEYGVPIHSDPELAQALLSVEVGFEIPLELYRAVAEILAFLYQLDDKNSQHILD
ncbi:EscU/YscU/HrcU family type III secretion system export apparatus switch protein [Thermosediminibacter litoriperuensis]|uniref:Flagellar biosynthesis protein n=1 Tax=Thermosediminibacter litoriperuensis TaxID=291989 RepID=A0A5S5ANU2_9FIRM|nr:EscU/YscU/HrcU family type III secretion system export apparatus switch protein [Thermosediminibacter litoriperuensis]TYP53327.1 flagellar biosynthesis protein [Thermosediminibacter litoriperuensis]